MIHAGTVELKTEHLVLRRFTIEDVSSVYQNYGSDPLVHRYISFAPCKDLKSTRKFIQMHIEQYDDNPSFYGWAITLHNEVIGSIGLFDVDLETEQAELGYSLGSKWWGEGYATEAAMEVIRFAFNELKLLKVYASHHIDNIASGKVLSKIGMQNEGIMHHGQKNADGSFSDLKLYGIVIQDWRNHYEK